MSPFENEEWVMKMQNIDMSYKNQDDTFSITRRKMDSYNCKHVHGTYEMLYLFSGERSFFINDRTFKMNVGDIVLISPNVLHRAIDAGHQECEGILMYFHEDYLAKACPDNNVFTKLFESEYLLINLPLIEHDYIDGILKNMLMEIQTQNTGYELMLYVGLIQVLVFLFRYVRQNSTRTFDYPSPIHEKISEIVRYINSHYMEDLSLTSLADSYYISPVYLSKMFKEATSYTLVEYINTVRVKEAKKLLMNAKKKVVQIAEEVGFGSITNFGRVFKEITGHPPLYFKKTRDI
jgi:YesN/AraC family two-component response regulator